MFTAKEIIGSNTMSAIDPSGSIRKSFFWYPDKEDKKRIAKLSKHNAFRYVKEFLPAFGFYKFREPDQEEGPYLIVQKLGRRVKVLGSVKDMEVSEKIFDWTLTTLEVIGGVAGDINTEHLIDGSTIAVICSPPGPSSSCPPCPWWNLRTMRAGSTWCPNVPLRTWTSRHTSAFRTGWWWSPSTDPRP